MMLRVTATGDLIWEKTFKSRLWDSDTTDGSVDVIDCKQDANGDLYLGGDVRHAGFPRQALAFKIDSSGTILWSTACTPSGYNPYFSGVNISGNRVTFVGNVGNYNGNDLLAVVMDTARGDTLSSKILRPFSQGFWTAFYYSGMVTLDDGNLALFGSGVSGLSTTAPGELNTHYGIVEITPGVHFVTSYLLRSPRPTNVYDTKITVFKDASAAYTRRNYTSGYTGDVIFGDFKNGQILKERAIHYRGIGTQWISNFLPLNDGGQLITSTFIDSATWTSAVEFTRLHNSDTASTCLGKDTAATFVQKETFVNAVPYFDSVVVNVLSEDPRPFKGIFSNNFIISSNCKQTSFCDSLKLSTPKDTVCGNSTVLIKVSKNKECGASPLWTYDTTAVSSFYKVNDSTVSATFNKPWQGTILASVSGCTTKVDSLHFTVMPAPAGLALGPDTVICPGNTILLNAKSGFVKYTWQDGSTDSIFAVTTPGQYYVTATDGCSNQFSDTVAVASHPPIPFDLGSSFSICQNDTATITAPGGFTNYRWTLYNIIGDTLQTARIYPTVSSWYKATAQQDQGCYVSDSVYVTVKTVPPVNLGNDTSFCADQSVTLNAGKGYDSYSWSNGSTGEKITVNQQGIYSVQASLNGCSTSDTLRIGNVYPLPAFSLGNDTTLCETQSLLLAEDLANAAYLWNTGDTANSLLVRTQGIYWLQATQNGCSKSDSIVIKYKPMPIVDLGRDTTLCEGNSLSLDATNANASYAWEDGSQEPVQRVSGPGLYYVTVNLNGCVRKDSVLVNKLYKPAFTLGRDTSLCTGESITLEPSISDVSFVWQDGSDLRDYTVTAPGVYQLTATNVCGSTTRQITITQSVCGLFMPNAFTPNDDGINDLFRVKYPGFIRTLQMIIYNRFGQVVFKSADPCAGWDGNYKGAPQPAGIYVWTIVVTGTDNTTQSAKGTVQLIR